LKSKGKTIEFGKIFINLTFMDNKDILLIILPFISAIIGAWITFFFTMKIKKNENIIKFREEKYANLLILLQGFIGNTTS
jgi:hypothetical protein